MVETIKKLHSSKTGALVTVALSIAADKSILTGYICLDTTFDLSNRVVSDSKINIWEKDLDFAPIQRKINKPEL